jgi:hypothetical protein
MDIGDKFCFCLSELAKRWNCAEDDILNLATKNKIWLSVNLNGYGRELTIPVPISGWWQLLIPAEIGGFFPNRTEAYFTGFRNPKDNTYRIIKTAADGERVRFRITRDSLVVMADEVKRYEAENPASFLPGEKVKSMTESNTALRPTQKSGRKKNTLTEAIIFAYLYFWEQGNTEILRPGKIRDFLARLKEMCDERNDNYNEYISERICEVKMSPADCFVRTAEQVVSTNQSFEKTVKSKKYKKQDVSKILSDMRKKKPI